MMNPVKAVLAAVQHSLAQTEPAPLFDRRSIPVYGSIGIIAIMDLCVLAFSDFYLGRSTIVRTFPGLILLVALALYLRRRHLERFGLALEAIAIPTLAGVLAVTGTTFLAAVSGPFVDSALHAADRSLGFDFPALAEFYRQHPALATASRHAYFSFGVQLAVVPCLLAVANLRRSLWVYLTGWCLALYLSTLIFPFAPAQGPFVYYGIPENVFVNFQRLFPWKFGPTIEALRSGALRDVGEAARGLISIPSFHAAGGVFFSWAGWHFRWLRWPVLALNLAMIASTIITGSHYLIDVIAGLILAGLALWIAGRVVRRLERAPSSNGGMAAAG